MMEGGDKKKKETPVRPPDWAYKQSHTPLFSVMLMIFIVYFIVSYIYINKPEMMNE